MKHIILFLGAAIGLAGCGQSPHCQTEDAKGLIQALEPKKQFTSMLTMVVKGTHTAGMTAARDRSAASEKIAQAVDAAVERHEAEWERNLLAAWQTLSPTEVEQVCAALQKGDRQTFMRFAERVGPEVQSRNEPVVRRAGVELLGTIS